MIPCAEMVRFGKNGSDATSGAVRVARAYTGRERVACCGYHGWQDWYIGTTTRKQACRGRPRAHPPLRLQRSQQSGACSAHPGEFAAVIMEPMNFVEPLRDTSPA